MRLGQLQLGTGEAGRAQPLFKAALAVNGENDRVHAGLGDALKLQMQTDAVGPHFLRAVELGPNDPLNHLDLAEYLRERAFAKKRGAERTREARKVLRRAPSTRQNGSRSENFDKAIESIRDSRVKAAHEYMDIADTETETSAAIDE